MILQETPTKSTVHVDINIVTFGFEVVVTTSVLVKVSTVVSISL